MKLRSGKIVYKALPQKLEEKLNKALKTYQELLIDNKDCAENLIKIIKDAKNMDACHKASRIINNEFGEIQEGIGELRYSVGTLITLITGDNEIYLDPDIRPIFHDEIESKLLIGHTNE